VTLSSGSITGTTGELTGANYNVTNTVGTTTISAILAGNGQLTKTGAGTLTLSGANTYTGATSVNAGTVVVANNTALGSVLGDTSVAAGATLDLQGVAVGAESINLNGGVLATSVGSSSLAGNVVLGADSEINVIGTQLEIAGQISGVAYDYVKTGAGRLVLSGNNTYTGRTTISAGTIQVSSTGNLGSVTNNLVIASGAKLDLQTALTLGSLNMVAGAEIINSAGTSSLTVNGISSVAGTIRTSGNQVYNDDLRLVGTTTIQSAAGDVLFEGTITAPNNTKSLGHSLVVTAAGTVTINDRIGMPSPLQSNYANFGVTDNVHNLTVTAATININADISTMEEQVYNGAVIIGGASPVRTLLSLDPMIRFNGTVDDAAANTHTLIARAVSVSTNPGTAPAVPKVIFERAVGASSPLYALQAITGVQSIAANAKAGDVDVASTIASPFSMIGQVAIKSSVSTLQDQTYVGNRIDVGGTDSKLVLTTKSGIINIYAGQNFAAPVGFEPGVQAVPGVQIALKGKLGKETAANFKLAGVKFSQDAKGGYVEAALANVQSKSNSLNDLNAEKIAKVTVGPALKAKGGRLSTFDNGEDEKPSQQIKQQKVGCDVSAGEQCPAK
jgi:fibronectin-binding autotransporter adhesin